jgi:hypothetical protein
MDIRRRIANIVGRLRPRWLTHIRPLRLDFPQIRRSVGVLAAAGFFDGGYVDLLHGHHGFEDALGFGAAGGHAVG